MIDMRRTTVGLALLVIACSPGRKEEGQDVAKVDSAAPADSASGMAGMDHSKMPGMAGSDTVPGDSGAMKGMDHTNMPGMDAGPSTAPMGGMDHSKMPGMNATGATSRSDAPVDHANMPGMERTPTAATTPMAGMDHSNMTGMGGSGAVARPPAAGGAHAGMNMSGSAPAPAASGMPGMDHGAMPGMASAGSGAADTKLVELVSLLANDSVVLRRIQADTVLRNRWRSPALRRLLEK